MRGRSRRLVFVAGPLEGRIAIVTGGGGGLAEGICAKLASDGAAVAAVDVSCEKAERVADQVRANGASVVARSTPHPRCVRSSTRSTWTSVSYS
jgi:NAD(P)-dependent dehydrogenase (short-subunit alcohol dehydrogenase family)